MRALIPVLLFCLSSCAFLKSIGSTDGEVDYAADAETNLQRGKGHLESRNYPEASKYFEYVKTKFPYIEAAKTAELLLADTDYERERFIEARDRYQNFVRLHPTHPKVDYAAYRAALTHYRDIPNDYFFLPSSSEKEQVEVRAALSSVNEFLNTFPHSEFVDQAKKIQTDVKRRLADHELYVAGFYAKRERWPAVVTRLQNVVKNYPGTGYEERVFFGLYEAYQKLKDEARGREMLATYVAKYPDDSGAKRAQRILESPMPKGEIVAVPVVTPSVPDAGP